MDANTRSTDGRKRIPAGARPGRAETPPADHWQRWTAEPASAVAAAPAAVPPLAASDAPASIGSAPPPLPGPSLLAEAGGNDPAPLHSDSPYRVLIVEDDRAQALFAQSVLHGAGMQAIVHSDADGALQAIKEHRPDLILMDLHLPGLDGMRLTALIRQQPGLQLLPIVFLSGDPDPERQFEVLDSGADDYLSKPIRPRHLIAAVANRIRRARAQAATLLRRIRHPGHQQSGNRAADAASRAAAAQRRARPPRPGRRAVRRDIQRTGPARALWLCRLRAPDGAGLATPGRSRPPAPAGAPERQQLPAACAQCQRGQPGRHCRCAARAVVGAGLRDPR